jgi:hypothetical protein
VDRPQIPRAALSDGKYRLLATSASQDPDATVTMQITGELTQGADSVQRTLGQAAPAGQARIHRRACAAVAWGT